MTTGATLVGKKKTDRTPPVTPPETKPVEQDSAEEKGTEFTATARLRPNFLYRLNQIANREKLRKGRKVPVGEIIEREMKHWVSKQWEEIQGEE